MLSSAGIKLQWNFISRMYFVLDGWLLAINDEQIKTAVMFGNRPPLDAITAPADLMPYLKSWIARCWDESPDERPYFHG